MKSRSRLSLYELRDAIKEIDSCDYYSREFSIPIEFNSRFQKIPVLCPFHDDHRPGSVNINTQTGAFYCYSCSAYAGDIIAFKQRRYNLDFIRAVRTIAEEWRLS